MRKIVVLALTLIWGSAVVLADTPREQCGIQSQKKFFRFKKRSFLISDVGTLEFTNDGGFVFYSESGINTFWHMNAENFTLTSRTGSWGIQGYTKYNLASLPVQSSRPILNWMGWRRHFEELDDALIKMSMYMTEASDSTVEEAGAALNCAQKIMYCTLARAQESLLGSQSSQQ
jgi:hypothetical protein